MLLGKSLMACALSAMFIAPSHARDSTLVAGSGWNGFGVDVGSVGTADWADIPGNSFEKLYFTFSIAAGLSGTLTVVDGTFAGDTFAVYNGAALLGDTSAVPVVDIESASSVGSYDNAFVDPAFSRAVFTLAAGNYRINGSLVQSVLAGGVPLGATDGAVKLDLIAAIPEPSTWALTLAGFGVLAMAARRRSR